MAALAVSSLTLVSPARAGSYSAPQYSGGTHHAPGPDGTPADLKDGPTNGGWGGGSGGSKSANCSGAITTTFTWNPTPGQVDPAPESAIVTETSNVGASGASYPPGTVGGSVDDGFSHTAPMTQSPIMGGPTQVGTSGTASLTGNRYSVQPGSAVSLTCTPTATASASTTASSSLTYTASATPIVIEFDGAMKNGSGQYYALTGQRITASLSALPTMSGTAVTYQWSAGGKTFKTYNETAPANQLVPLSAADMAAATFTFYDRASESLTVTCTASFTAPDGTSLTVTASRHLTMEKPSASWPVTSGGFHDQHTYMEAANVWGPVQITMPPDFSAVGGTGCFAQLITPSRSMTRNPINGKPSTYYFKVPQTVGGTTTWVMPGIGLDTSYPYPAGALVNPDGSISPTYPPGGYTWSVSDTGISGDEPSQPYTTTDIDGGGSAWYRATAADSFVTWLMYKPYGTAAVWVPVQQIANWSWNGTATKGTDGNWTATGFLSTGQASNTDDPPQWNIIISANDQLYP